MFNNNNNSSLEIVSPFKEEIPRAFIYPLTINKSPYYYGKYANTIWTFAQYRNLKLRVERLDTYLFPEVEQKLISGHYNLSMHGSVFRLQNTSYPVEYINCCILVPTGEELPKYYYVIWPFESAIWLTLFVAVFYIAILLRFLEHTRAGATRSVSHHLLQSVAIIVNASNLNVNLQNRPIRIMIFYLLLFVLGFILSVFHQTLMTSFCMKPIVSPPPNTVADLVRTNLKVLVTINILNELRETNSTYLDELAPLIRTTDWQHLVAELETLNRSVAYIVPYDLGEFILKQQMQLQKPYFFLTSICVGGGFNAFPLQPNSALAISLNIHILAVQQAGLWYFWEREAFDVAVYAGRAKIYLETFEVTPFNVEGFMVAWIVLLIGLLLSICTFTAEYIYWETKLKRHRRYVDSSV